MRKSNIIVSGGLALVLMMVLGLVPAICYGSEGEPYGESSIVVVPEDDSERNTDAAATDAVSIAPVFSGSAHVQRLGWVEATKGKDGTVILGTTGQALRMEAIRLTVTGGAVSYQAHVQSIGWDDWASDGQIAGTEGQSKRLEAIRIVLDDELASNWSIQYRCHVQTFGWMGWAADGDLAGSTGFGKRMEAIEVRVVPAGTALPAGDAAWRDNGLYGEAHVQGIGWAGQKHGSPITLGTTDQGRRIEAFTLEKPADFTGTGDVVYSAHVQGIGWQDARAHGEVAGTTGESRRVEAVTIDLTGELATTYDVWYRVHVQGIGWLGWTKNGAQAGTEGMRRRCEAIQIALLAEGSGSPSADGQARSEAFLRSTFSSGDNDLDYMLDTIALNVTGLGSNALRNGYEYVAGFAYRHQNKWPEGDWMVWSKEYAKQMYREGSGNCYRYASLMCWIARRLGYDASVVAGEIVTGSGRDPHSWVEVVQDGTVYVVDCERHRNMPGYGFFMITYGTAPIYYVKNGVIVG